MKHTATLQVGTLVLLATLSSTAFGQETPFDLPLHPCPPASVGEQPFNGQTLDEQSDPSFGMFEAAGFPDQGAAGNQPCDLSLSPSAPGDSFAAGFDLPTEEFGSGQGFLPVAGAAVPSHSPQQIREASSRAASEAVARGLGGGGQGFLAGLAAPALGLGVSDYENLLRELANHVRYSTPASDEDPDRQP